MQRNFRLYSNLTASALLLAGIALISAGGITLLDQRSDLLLPFLSGLVKGGAAFPGFVSLRNAAAVVLIMAGSPTLFFAWQHFRQAGSERIEYTLPEAATYVASKKLKIFFFCVLTAYAILGIFGIAIHEPWGDEAQSWIIARDCSLSDFFRQMSYEGSPGLWHLILMPFAKAGFPYITQSILHLLIATAATAIFLFRAPFHPAFKVLFVFSYLIAYEYSVIARSYMLSFLLLFAIAAIYNSRLKMPLIYGLLLALLVNTNVHSFGAAGILVLFYFWDIRKHTEKRFAHFAGAAIMTGGALLALFQVIPTADNMHQGWMVVMKAPVFAVSNSLIPRPFSYVDSIAVADYLLCGLFMLLMLLFINRPRWLLFLSLSVGWLFYIYIFKDSGTARHQGFILIFVIVALWISGGQHSGTGIMNMAVERLFRKLMFFVTGTCLAISVFIASWFFINDYRYPFCGSREMAGFIETSGLSCNDIVAHNSHPAVALLPWSAGRPYWYPAQKAWGTYVIWNKVWLQQSDMNASEIIQTAKQYKPGGLKRTLFLFGRKTAMTVQPADSLVLLHKTSEPVFGYGDVFYLYSRMKR